MITHIIGIDEAGRGPLAGPVSVGLFCVPVAFKKKLRKEFPGARDSKKMTAALREEVFAKIVAAEKKGLVQYIVAKESAAIIDKKGITMVIRNCIEKSLRKFNLNPKSTRILLDGSLKAPEEFMYQKTIIKGDDKELVISLASICAKVVRDKYMVQMAKKYPAYKLDIHKGYGTKLHRTAIQKFGLSEIHRKTFCRNIF